MEAIVFYHGDCPDGFGAAWAARHALGDKAVCRPAFYGRVPAPETLAGKAVYVVDFSFPPAALEAMAASAASVVQLDHHASARDAWIPAMGAPAPGTETWRHPGLPLSVVFDMDKSGARLTWEHFHADRPMPLPLCHIEDQDLWRFALPATRAFNRALRLLPWDFAVWDALMLDAATAESPRYREMIAEGEAIERFFRAEVERLAGGSLAVPVRLPGAGIGREHARREGIPFFADADGAWRLVDGLAVNASGLFASELGERLAERSGGFGLVWVAGADGMVKASLRAAGRVDVARMAEHFGGGGHRNAAAFRMPLARFVAEILQGSLPEPPAGAN